ncbi:hypothetical protein MMC29_004665, partial [Sticta canariensis]|nr:hypothetical protein [Sticta canariensis]
MTPLKVESRHSEAADIERSAVSPPYEERSRPPPRPTGHTRHSRFPVPQSPEQLRRNVQRNLDRLRNSPVTVPPGTLVVPPHHTARPEFGGIRLLDRLTPIERILLDIVVVLVLLTALALLCCPVEKEAEEDDGSEEDDDSVWLTAQVWSCHFPDVGLAHLPDGALPNLSDV